MNVQYILEQFKIGIINHEIKTEIFIRLEYHKYFSKKEWFCSKISVRVWDGKNRKNILKKICDKKVNDLRDKIFCWKIICVP